MKYIKYIAPTKIVQDARGVFKNLLKEISLKPQGQSGECSKLRDRRRQSSLVSRIKCGECGVRVCQPLNQVGGMGSGG